MPCQVGSAQRGPFEAGHLGLLFGSRVSCGVACCLEGSPSDSRPPSSRLRLVGPSLALDTRLHSFGYWWSRSCLDCWAITGGPRYPRYKTLTFVVSCDLVGVLYEESCDV
jgi:hypothetical protein